MFGVGVPSLHKSSQTSHLDCLRVFKFGGGPLSSYGQKPLHSYGSSECVGPADV